MRTNRSRERGSVAAATVIVVLVLGLGAALVSVSFRLNTDSGMRNEHIVCSYAAEAALENAWLEMNLSNYDDTGNLWLMDSSQPDDGDDVYPSPGDSPIFDDLAVGRATVDVYIYSLDAINTYYRVVARAEMGDRQVTMAQDVRARDTFARYMFFVDADSINFGTSTVHGAVHSNKKVNFYFGGAKFYDEVSAGQGFTYNSGATTDNTTFYDTTSEDAPHINMPAVNEINALRPEAAGVYDVHNDNSFYGGNGTMNAEIILMGDQVRIIARRSPSMTVVKDTVAPMPPNGIIFVQGDVIAVEGQSSRPLTIATPGNVSVTNPITYQDQDGDSAYLLLKDGVPVDPQSTGTEAWTEANGYEYVKNPDYNPTGPDRPVVGLLAGQDVEIDNSAPYNMEMHAAVFSATKKWSCDLTQQKGNIAVLGSIVNKQGGWRYNSLGYGYAKSGRYIYDTELLQNPPPFWLPVDKPVKGSRFEVSRS